MCATQNKCNMKRVQQIKRCNMRSVQHVRGAT